MSPTTKSNTPKRSRSMPRRPVRKLFLRRPEAAEALGISLATLYRWERDGILPRAAKPTYGVSGWSWAVLEQAVEKLHGVELTEDDQ